jgi:UPF0755 protein
VIRLGRRSRSPKWLRAILVSVLSISLLSAGLVAFNYDWIKAQYLELTTLDYPGPGTGEVLVQIASGDNGLVVSRKLFDAGVVRDVESFYRLLLKENPIFYPGSFPLRLEMSNRDALAFITEPLNALKLSFTIPEGYRVVQIFAEISKATGIEESVFWDEAKNLEALGIPRQAPTIEGYLFPATYSFDLDVSAKEILITMIERMKQELIKYKVEQDKWHEFLTLASIVQREAKQTDDFFKVSRVFANRIAINMPLETDPTISYSYDGTDMSKTSREEQIRHGYNTYLVRGLPPGPISSPGSLAIDATLNPADGNWLFFVTVNLATGETKFSATLAEHERYVKLLRQWEKENPGWYDN